MSSSSGFVPLPPLGARAAFRRADGTASGAASPASTARSKPKSASTVAAGKTETPEVREAYERGLAEGLAKGRDEGAEAAHAELPLEDAELLRSAAEALGEAARGIAVLQRGYWIDNRRIVAELALAIAERIVRRELTTNPDALAGTVERALEALGETPAAELRLAPAVATAIEAGRAPGLAELGERNGLKIVADPRLAAGDARVLAERSNVDARLSESLRRIAEEFVEAAEATPLEEAEPAGDSAEASA